MSVSEQQAKEADERNLQFALRKYDNHAVADKTLFDSAMGFALEGIRTAALINGGAVIACFALIGSMRGGADPLALLAFKQLLLPALLFSIGAVLAGCASGFAYFAQLCFLTAHQKVKYKWEHPYIEDLPGKKRRAMWGECWRVVCIISVVVSYLCIMAGLYLGFCRLAA